LLLRPRTASGESSWSLDTKVNGDVRIALVVMHSLVGKVSENLEKTRHFAREAARREAHLVCFPEMSLTGYCLSGDIVQTAEPIPGALSRQVGDLARSLGIIVLVGMLERGPDERLHIAHVVGHPNGGVTAYRKTHLNPVEKALYRAGEQVPVFAAAGHFRFGIQLCYDAHFPELSTQMALGGAEVLFLPHASPGRTPRAKEASWMRHLPARAYDNGLFVAACNQTGDNGAGLSFPGLALVLDPLGTVLAREATGAEGMLLAELPAANLRHVQRHRMRYFLPHRRPDLYRAEPTTIHMSQPGTGEASP